MNSRNRVALLGIVMLLTGGSNLPAQVYPLWQPYGAQRGKMVIRNGLLGYRQKVHWGNGLNQYGAAVLTQAIQTTGEVLPQVIGREVIVAQIPQSQLQAESEEGARELASERSQRTTDLQRTLRECEQKNRELDASIDRLSRSIGGTESARDADDGLAAELPSPSEAIKPRIQQYTTSFAAILRELEALKGNVSALIDDGEQIVHSARQEQTRLQAAAQSVAEGNDKLRRLLDNLNKPVSE